MNESKSRITRVAQTITLATSQIFRCRGLQYVPPQADNLGGHDLLYWLIFVLAACVWFLFLFAPQRERRTMLEGRHDALKGHLNAENRELRRLTRGIDDLVRGDPYAWERAARGRLGWVEPGEITDVLAWCRQRKSTQPAPPQRNTVSTSLSPTALVLPRPAIPSIPAPPTPAQQQILTASAPTRAAPPSLNRPVPRPLRLHPR